MIQIVVLFFVAFVFLVFMYVVWEIEECRTGLRREMNDLKAELDIQADVLARLSARTCRIAESQGVRLTDPMRAARLRHPAFRGREGKSEDVA
ncbi:hypothetical protein [Corynebacterium sp. TAE3-ERU2]|uniref:hypothetical protein n=1 Tax=Corynebacterium sp. TAE3-ERU2 TaxID=2849497 RepID=UPI001C43CDD9|nr:hypothetical protein [Corynebacterium sp. TAE3-ERU2]MBV7302921.1 hypothetical protein [Corynebacterium sp. TAE3-ERU2]